MTLFFSDWVSNCCKTKAQRAHRKRLEFACVTQNVPTNLKLPIEGIHYGDMLHLPLAEWTSFTAGVIFDTVQSKSSANVCWKWTVGAARWKQRCQNNNRTWWKTRKEEKVSTHKNVDSTYMQWKLILEVVLIRLMDIVKTSEKHLE